MQIVIDIPEKVCEDHKNNRHIDIRLFKSGDEFNRAVTDICDHPFYEEMSVYTLPKGHGRLIDEDSITYDHVSARWIENMTLWDVLCAEQDQIVDLPTVVPSDKE